MRVDILKALIQNATLLMLVYLFLTRLTRWKALKKPLSVFLVQGLVYTLCGILAMMFSVEVLPGVLIDMRTPIIVVATLTSGPVVGVFTIIPLIVYRLVIGGDGMIAGFGIIISAFLFGLILRFIEKSRGKKSGLFFQLFSGLGAAAIYLVWILILPESYSLPVLNLVAIPMILTSVTSMLAIFFIREREHTHQKLLDNLTEINDLYEELSLDENIGIVILQKSTLVYVNKSLLKKFSFTHLDKDNSDLLEIVDDRTRSSILQFLSRDFSSLAGESIPLEIGIQGKNSLHLLTHARRLLYRGKESLLIVSVDISKLIETENNLQLRLDQLQLTFDASGAVIWEALINEDKLVAGNEFYEILSYSAPELPQQFSVWLREMCISEEMLRNIGDVIEGRNESTFGEISYTGTDFVKRWFNIGIIVNGTDSAGKPEKISGILFDTTIIKENELSLLQEEIEDIQSQKMESIGRLAGGVAHDFNNLLHVIMGYCDILNRVAENDTVITDVSRPIVQAAEKGSELVKQLLLFSREKKPMLQNINLGIIIRDFSKLLSRIIEDNIVISTKVLCNSCWIFGDPGQLEQVLMNLCVNSRDAMPLGGKIDIFLTEEVITHPTTVTSGTLKPNSYLIVSVTDTGPGIPEFLQKKVFEPFFSTKEIDGGTGLGLATVLGIVKDHSGFINVGNSSEKGLEVKVFFPKLTVDATTSDNTQSEKSSFAHPRDKTISPLCVLLAEDDLQVMNLAIEGLGAAGIRVIRAVNGKEAVKIFHERKNEIDMLVFDVMMPEMNGPDAYEMINKTDNPLPVVFTTGYAGDRLAAIEGNHEIISKPYSMRDLVAVIRKMTGNGAK